jgi:hypothetical protein
MHGPGSTFTGSFGLASQVVSGPGSTGTFALQVKNNGQASAQFNMQVFYLGAACSSACSQPIDTLSAGSLVVTPLAHGPNGYFTAPIAAGKTAPFTLKVVTPKAPQSLPGDTFQYEVVLYDTAGNFLDLEFAYVSNKLALGALGADEYVSASGTAATTATESGQMVVTAPVFAVGATATFTIKLKNDSAVPEPIHFQLGGLDTSILSCASSFAEKVVVGTTDVTAQALAGTYATPTLAHGASTTLKLTVKYLQSAVDCLVNNTGHGFLNDIGIASNSTSQTLVFLVMDPLAEN